MVSIISYLTVCHELLVPSGMHARMRHIVNERFGEVFLLSYIDGASHTPLKHLWRESGSFSPSAKKGGKLVATFLNSAEQFI